MKNIEISIADNERNNFQHLSHLKDYINNQDLLGIGELDFVQVETEKGKMGLNEVVTALTTIISAASAPLTELVKTIQVYIQSFKTDIEIKIGESSIKISSKNPQETQKVVSEILNILEKSPK